MHTNQILERGKSEEKLTTGHGFISSFFPNKSLNMVPSMYSVGFAWISGILHSAHNIAFGIVFSSFCWHNLELPKTFSSRLLDILFLHIFFLVLFVVYFFFLLKGYFICVQRSALHKRLKLCAAAADTHTHTHFHSHFSMDLWQKGKICFMMTAFHTVVENDFVVHKLAASKCP